VFFPDFTENSNIYFLNFGSLDPGEQT
jgi:hypothetical protein